MPIMPSPTAASLVRNATASPNLYTGAVNVSIPLYTLPAQGMSIPIGLVYQTNGIKVNEKNGPLGMTWSLQGGGAIARIVRGYPDEFNGEMKKEIWLETDPNTKEKSTIKVKGNWYSDFPTDYQTNLDSYNKILDYKEGKDNEIWDSEPDKYFFSAPGLAGSFYIPKKNSAPIIHCDADIDIQIHFENNQLMGFVITTASGLCYEFGMYSQCIEKQSFSTQSKISEARFKRRKDTDYHLEYEFEDCVYTKTWIEDKNAYTSSWYLKRIITPFHADAIQYTYETGEDQENSQAQSFDANIDNSFNSCSLNRSKTQIRVSRYPKEKKYLSQVFIAKQTSTKLFVPKKLKSIESSSGKMELTYTDTDEKSNARISSVNIYGLDKKTIQKKIDLEYNQIRNKITEPKYPNLSKKYGYLYSLHSTRKDANNAVYKGINRYFLSEIKEIDKTSKDTLQLFSFQYKNPEQLPEFCSQMQNHYGFYINYPSLKSQFYIDENSNYYPFLALDINKGDRQTSTKPTGYIATSPRKPNLIENGKDLNISDTTVVNGLLISMQNATGAVTKFVYDATFEGAILKHSYTYDGDKKIQTINFTYENSSIPLGYNSRIYTIGKYKTGISPWGRTEELLTQAAPLGYGKVSAKTNGIKNLIFFTTAQEYNNTLGVSTCYQDVFTGVTVKTSHNYDDDRDNYNSYSFSEFIDLLAEEYPIDVRSALNKCHDSKNSYECVDFVLKELSNKEIYSSLNFYFNKRKKLVNSSKAKVGRPTERDQLRGKILRKETYNLKGKLSGVEEYDYTTLCLNKYEAKKQVFMVSESDYEASEDKYIAPYSIDYETLRLNSVKSKSYVSEKESVSSESSIEKYSQIHPLLPEVSVLKNLTTNDIWRTETTYLKFKEDENESTDDENDTSFPHHPSTDEDDGNGGSNTNNSPKYNPYPKYTTQKQVAYKNNRQLSGSEVVYNQSTRLPEQVKIWIDGKYETSITYDKFDYKTRLLQAHGRDGVPTSYRYKGNFLEITAQNATYQEISNGKAEDLRKNLPKAIIASAKYSPEGFLLNQTDANGYSVYYEYDDFGRLKLLRDHDKNLITAYDYQYGKVGQETISSDKLGIGQMVVGENFVVGGYTNTKTQGLPSAGKNYIANFTFKAPNSEFEDRNAPNRAAIAIEYQDGLGRAIQQVAINSLPQEYNLIQSFEYDSLGRQAIQYRSLPILSDSKYKKDWKQFLKNKYETSYKAESSFDAYNRIQKQGSFGENYALNKHAGTNQYGMNQVSIPSYKADLNSEDYQKKNYPKGTLYKTAVSFEGITNVSYKNMDGQVVRKAAVKGMQTSDPDYGSALITDYVYDDYGNLRAILPPQAKGDISAGNYVYKFLYDERNRLIKKEIPGAGCISMEYDELDRLIRETDAKGTTSYIKYDELSRPIETGYFSQEPPLTPPSGQCH